MLLLRLSCASVSEGNDLIEKILLPCGINDVGAADVVEVVLKYEGAAAVGAGVAEGVLIN